MAGRTSFDDFARARGAHLVRVAYLLTRDRYHAEDLVQTALVRSWSAWRRIDGDPEAYVRRVLVNTYASWRGRRWHGELPSDALPESAQVGPDVDVDDRDALWRALGRLPYQQRAVLVLRYYEDMTEAQIAGALGIAAGTVKAHASRALAALRVDASLRAEASSVASHAKIDRGTTPSDEVADGGDEAQRLASAITSLADLASIDTAAGEDLTVATRGRIRRQRIQRAVTMTTALALLVAAVIAALVTAGVRVHAGPPANPSINGPRVGDRFGDIRIVAVATASTAGNATLTWTPTTTEAVFFGACAWPAPKLPLTDDTWYVAASYNGSDVAGGQLCVSDGHLDLSTGEVIPLGTDRIGVPTTVTAHITGSEDNAPNATPGSTGTMYVAVGERVPFGDYQAPTRPATLVPITCDGIPRDAFGNERTDLTLLGPDAPGGRMSVTLSPGSYVMTARSQTPGIATVSAAGRADTWAFSFYNYIAGLATYMPIDVVAGSTLTLSVSTQYMTGDWWVGIHSAHGSDALQACPS